MAKKNKKKKKSFADEVWETFAQTGNIGAYLLYKNLNGNGGIGGNGGNDNI